MQAASQPSDHVVLSENHTECIVREGMQRVLANIGASDRVSPKEIQSIFDELGNEWGEIGSQTLMKII